MGSKETNRKKTYNGKEKSLRWRMGLAVLLLAGTMLLSACRGGMDSPNENATTEAAMESYDEYYEADYYGEADAAPAEEAPAAAEGGSIDLSGGGQGSGGFESSSSLDLSQHKIIRSGEIYISTEAYDDTIALIQDVVNKNKGYIEDMRLEGTAPEGAYDEGRSGFITLRVPSSAFDASLNALRKGGTVTYESISSQNVSSQYRDTEAHIASIDIHMESLNNLMAKTTDMEDMLRLEEEISRLRYEKESLESNLRNWDDLVSYSTISIHLQELNTIIPTVEEEKPIHVMTFGEEASYRFRSAWNGLVNGLRGFALGLLAVWPLLLVLVVAAIIIVPRVIRNEKARKAKEAKRSAEFAQKQAQMAERREAEKGKTYLRNDGKQGEKKEEKPEDKKDE